MSRVAFMTIGVLKDVVGAPLVQGFSERVDPIFAMAEHADGFIGHPYDSAGGKTSWGDWALPALFQDPAYEPRVVATLSLWRDLESVFTFAYRGIHAEALGKRREWFVAGGWPVYVAWWVDDDHLPSWREASERYEQLHAHGALPGAFNFRQPFGADGQPVQLDREALRSKLGS